MRELLTSSDSLFPRRIININFRNLLTLKRYLMIVMARSIFLLDKWIVRKPILVCLFGALPSHWVRSIIIKIACHHPKIRQQSFLCTHTTSFKSHPGGIFFTLQGYYSMDNSTAEIIPLSFIRTYGDQSFICV